MKSVILTLLLISTQICNAQSSPPPTVLFGPTHNLEKTLISHLKKASKRIFVATYLLTNARVVHELIAAHSRSIDVQIITDRRMAESMRGRQVIRQLRTHHIPLMLFANHNPSALMHHKFAVVDDKAWLGSANWTTAGLQHNAENIIISSNRSLSQRLTTHFRTLKKRILGLPVTTSHHSKDTLFFIPDHRHSLIKRLINDIQNARHSIEIACFEFSHNRLITALRAAMRRGISISIITDAETKKLIPQLPLRTLTIPRGCFHHKFALIDDTVWTGSMNWTHAGATYHQESIGRFRIGSVVAAYRSAFRQLINKSNEK